VRALSQGSILSEKTFMEVLPVPHIPSLQNRFLNSIPPAGLVILERSKRVLPPLAEDGNGLPPDQINPYSGIYDANGKLPSPPNKLAFLVYV
jgi:hypothetical protein